MNILCLDMEYNMPSGKIIEIGYTISDVKTQKIKLAKSILVNPGEVLSADIIELTGITDEMLIGKPTLQEAYLQLLKDKNDYQCNKHILQWGSDHMHLFSELQKITPDMHWGQFCFAKRANDVKSLYQSWAMIQPNGKSVAGLSGAMKTLGMLFEGRQHRALVDAENTLNVFHHLTDKFKQYEQIKKVIK